MEKSLQYLIIFKTSEYFLSSTSTYSNCKKKSSQILNSDGPKTEQNHELDKPTRHFTNKARYDTSTLKSHTIPIKVRENFSPSHRSQSNQRVKKLAYTITSQTSAKSDKWKIAPFLFTFTLLRLGEKEKKMDLNEIKVQFFSAHCFRALKNKAFFYFCQIRLFSLSLFLAVRKKQITRNLY